MKKIIWLVLLFAVRPAFAQYSVEPEQSFWRGHVWIGDGEGVVSSSNTTGANRFRAGFDAHFGNDYRFILGMTFLDRIYSGESSASAGGISRRGSDLNFGYFLIPDKLWLMYSLNFSEVSGQAAYGIVSPIGHQASVGYRFYEKNHFNLSVEAAYLFVNSYSSDTYNYQTGQSGTISFPSANIWTLNLRIGYDLNWGRW